MSGSFAFVRCARTRPRFILSSERVLGNGVRTHVKGATSQVAGSPVVLDRTVIVLDRTAIRINGVLSFPLAWRWVRPSLVTSHYETHQPSQLSSVLVVTDMLIRPCPALVCFLGPGVAPLTPKKKSPLAGAESRTSSLQTERPPTDNPVVRRDG